MLYFWLCCGSLGKSLTSLLQFSHSKNGTTSLKWVFLCILNESKFKWYLEQSKYLGTLLLT